MYNLDVGTIVASPAMAQTIDVFAHRQWSRGWAKMMYDQQNLCKAKQPQSSSINKGQKAILGSTLCNADFHLHTFDTL